MKNTKMFKILIFLFYFLLIPSLSHPLDPYFSYFTDISESISSQLNSNFDQIFQNILLPSYSFEQNLPKFSKIETKPTHIHNERILPASRNCNSGAPINVTRVDFYCNNISVTQAIYNSI